MTVSGVSSTDPYQNSVFQQARSDFQQLSQALKSGSVDQAKQALGSLQSDLPSSAANSPFAQVLDQIDSALQSGDINSAQQALAGLHPHHGHHHHHRPTADASSTTQPSSTNPDPSATVGTAINVLA
jgi:multidrug efflux pump subunit AcrA (membrane-fusion protein)